MFRLSSVVRLCFMFWGLAWVGLLQVVCYFDAC